MQVQGASVVSVRVRLLAYFGSLAAIGVLGSALLLLLGLPGLGIEGVFLQEYQRAIRAVESLADKERDVTERWFIERRKELQVLAQSEHLATSVLAVQAQRNLAVRSRLERELVSVRESRHGVYNELAIVDMNGKTIVGDGSKAARGERWQALLEDAAQPGVSELISIIDGERGPDIVVARQIVSRDATGNPTGKSLGLLVATLGLLTPLQSEQSAIRQVLIGNGAILLLDWRGRVLAADADGLELNELGAVSDTAVSGTEGVKLLKTTSGKEVIVAYRHLNLGAADGLSLAVVYGKDGALSLAWGGFWRVVILATTMFLIALLVILFVARRLEHGEQQILELNANLERRVQERTHDLSAANSRLQETLVHLEATRDELVRSERLASLGSLVAGVAHELNTPIGNALLVASTLGDTTRSFKDRLSHGLTRSALAEQVDQSIEGLGIVTNNLHRAADLIASFKQLSVDQASSLRRSFSLLSICNEVLTAMHPTLKKTQHQIFVDVPEDIVLDSYPGAVSQVLVNFINNALVHAFDADKVGTMRISATALSEGGIEIVFSDDGKGMTEEVLRHVFDPFFTTKFGCGGSGLGMHIVYSLVTQSLGGQIDARSELGKGTSWLLSLPLQAPDAKQDA